MREQFPILDSHGEVDGVWDRSLSKVSIPLLLLLLVEDGMYRPIPPRCAARSPNVTSSQFTGEPEVLFLAAVAAAESSGTHVLTGSSQWCSPASIRKSHVVKRVVKSPSW